VLLRERETILMVKGKIEETTLEDNLSITDSVFEPTSPFLDIYPAENITIYTKEVGRYKDIIHCGIVCDAYKHCKVCELAKISYGTLIQWNSMWRFLMRQMHTHAATETAGICVSLPLWFLSWVHGYLEKRVSFPVFLIWRFKNMRP
jgi:hypothetical protein